MQTTLAILAIVLAAATLLLLIFTITAVVLVVNVLKSIKQVVTKAQESAGSISDVIEHVRDTVDNPSLIAALVMRTIKKQIKKGKK